MAEKEHTRNVLLSLYAFLLSQLTAGGWEGVTVVNYQDGFPEDDRIRLPYTPSDPESLPVVKGEVVVPALALEDGGFSDDGDIGVGNPVAIHRNLWTFEFYCRSRGQEMSLRSFLVRTFGDQQAVFYDYSESGYPPVQVEPTVLGPLYFDGPVMGTPLYNPAHPNRALRFGGMVSLATRTYRGRGSAT